MEFILSNSKMRDWETMCPIEFKAKHIDKVIQFKQTEPMAWGSYFETVAIGGGINGVFRFEDCEFGEKMKKSVFFKRVEEQAEVCKQWLKLVGGKVKSRQEYILTEVRDLSGQLIPIEGTLDVRYLTVDGKTLIIDLKFTTDTESKFGLYSWGAYEKMDMSQIIHYILLTWLKYGGDRPEGQYWIFDSKNDLKKKLINVKVSDFAMEQHIERLSQVYNEITACIELDDWTPKNTYENCSKCQAKCKFERIMPEFHQIEL